MIFPVYDWVFFLNFLKCPSLFCDKVKIFNKLYGRVKRDFSFQENFRALLLICSNPTSLKMVWMYVSNLISIALNIGYWLKKTKTTYIDSFPTNAHFTQLHPWDILQKSFSPKELPFDVYFCLQIEVLENPFFSVSL